MSSLPEINVGPSKSAAGSTSASLKAAGSLVAKKAERTKLVTVTLPRAYADFGKSVYKKDALRDGFAELFTSIDELLAQRKQINEAGKARPAGNGLADKARKAAADATDLARSKAIDLQAFQAFAKLGEAVYLQHKDDADFTDAIKPIAVAVARREQLDRETASIQKESKGHWLTPKRIAWGLGIFVALGTIGAILDPDKGGGGGGGGSDGDGGRPTSQASGTDHAHSVLRQVCIGSSPDTVDALMRRGGLRRSRTENKTVNGSPVMAHFYCNEDVFFMYNRNISTGKWGLTGVKIDETGYFPPIKQGDNPIRMSE